MLAVIATLTIDNKKFTSNNMSLHQTYNGHHSFEMTIVQAKSDKMGLPLIKDILGKEMTITIKPKNPSSKSNDRNTVSLSFTGFVDEIHPSWSSTSRSLRVKGYSKSMVLDTAPKFRSFVEMSVNEIVSEIKQSYTSTSIPVIKDSIDSSKIPFAFQLQETDFQFLSRLVDSTNKMIYFNGTSLVLQDWDQYEVDGGAPLSLGAEVSHVDFSINTTPINFELSGYDYIEAQKINCQSKTQAPSNELASTILDQSKTAYPKLSMVGQQRLTQDNIESETNRLLAAQCHDIIRLHASTDQLWLKLGHKISIIDKKDKTRNEMFEYGSFLITQITHNVGSDGAYYNQISAIPEGFRLPIRMGNYKKPMAGPLVATVSKINDDKQLGRVKVIFRNDQSTSPKGSPWLRVLHPYTGRGGWYFTPEIGDEVMVMQEGYNIEKEPIVMGSFYHGERKADKWQVDGNHKKGFATDKVRFEIDDQSGKLTITAEELEFKATKSITLEGGNQLTQKATRIDLN